MSELHELMVLARAALHLDRPCPHCGALFSQPCRTASGHYRPQVHAERLRELVQGDLFGEEWPAGRSAVQALQEERRGWALAGLGGGQ